MEPPAESERKTPAVGTSSGYRSLGCWNSRPEINYSLLLYRIESWVYYRGRAQHGHTGTGNYKLFLAIDQRSSRNRRVMGISRFPPTSVMPFGGLLGQRFDRPSAVEHIMFLSSFVVVVGWVAGCPVDSPRTNGGAGRDGNATKVIKESDQPVCY